MIVIIYRQIPNVRRVEVRSKVALVIVCHLDHNHYPPQPSIRLFHLFHLSLV
jgi:hypothetical protein